MRKREKREIPESLEPVVGAMIFASDEPVLPTEMASALGGVDLARVEEAIQWLERHFERNDLGLQVERVAGGVRIAHLGDNGPLSDATAQELGRIDVLMAPADGDDHILKSNEIATIRGCRCKNAMV